MANSYLEFIDRFCKLNPFDLNHLSENLLCKIEDVFEEKVCGRSSGVALSEKDLKFALTETMRDVLLELRQREILNQNLRLDETKARIFATR